MRTPLFWPTMHWRGRGEGRRRREGGKKEGEREEERREGGKKEGEREEERRFVCHHTRASSGFS